MRVLITGGTGFVGQAVVAEAAVRGAAVGLVTRSEPVTSIAPDVFLLGTAPWSSEAIGGVLRRFQPDAIVHLAGGPAAASLEALYEANVFLCQSILEAGREVVPSARILVAGSAAEYGPPARADGRVRESDPAFPIGPYGIAKLAQTLHAMAAARLGQSIVVARLFNPVGAGMPAGLAFADFAQQIADGQPRLLTGDIDTERDFMPVGEAARILMDLADGDTPSQIVNVCSGRPQTVRKGVELLLARSGRRIELGESLGTRGARGGVRTIFGDTTRLRDLNIAPASPDIDNALGELLKSKTN